MIPLVFVPGMMCDGRLFAPQVAAFSGRHDIVLARISEADRVEDLAKRILANAPMRFALAGLSMGGIVAMEILRQAPERVDRIALLDTNPLAEKQEVKERRGPQIEAVRAGALARVMQEEMKPNYLAQAPQRQDILDLCMDMALGLGPEVFLRQSHALMTRPDQCETLRNANIPALVLCGAQDALCPVERHELMADLLPNARLKIVSNAGHLPTLEQPDETNKALSEWLQRAAA